MDNQYNNRQPEAGWRAQLELTFQQRAGKTVAVTNRHVGPLYTQRAYYPEGHHCHLYLLHPPGGVVGGDILATQIELEQRAGALLTMPGSTKIYRSSGPTAELRQCFRVDPHCTLEWLPPGTILFAGANAYIESEYQLSSNACLVARETFCFGRPVMSETFDSGSVSTLLSVTLDGQPLLKERMTVDGSLAVLSGYPLLSTLLIYPGSESLLQQVRVLTSAYPHPVGVTMLDGLLIVRMLANTNLELDAAQHTLWAAIREPLTGLRPIPPRIWAT
ncbi:urease accessory protein UreD [Carnimonas bestiolae]|uniref:urease accessory protein UreD n=1 Tax=Carnimonas bestiolae TaxID=3402172 RepID=UPI003F4ACB6C